MIWYLLSTSKLHSNTIMNPKFNTCELQTKARTLSTKTLGAHSPDWAQIMQMECGKNSFVKHFPSQWMLKEEHLASWTFQTTRDRSSFPPRLTFGIFEIWEDLWNEIYISDIWKELRRRREHLYQMLVSRVNGERGYCSMVSFMSANLWLWLHKIARRHLSEILIQYKQGDKLPEQNMIMRHLGPTLSLPNNYSCSHS